MAYRDKSQGFGFVYVDIPEFLRDARKEQAENLLTAPDPAEAQAVSVANSPPTRSRTVEQIREDLVRLEEMNKKLRGMLAKLEHLKKK